MRRTPAVMIISSVRSFDGRRSHRLLLKVKGAVVIEGKSGEGFQYNGNERMKLLVDISGGF